MKQRVAWSILGLSVILLACGGSGTSTPAGNRYTVGGIVSGLTGTGLILQNNGADDLSISADGNFTFATPVADGDGYNVTVQSQPSGQSCAVTNANGTISGADAIDVTVFCSAYQPSFTTFQAASVVVGQATFTNNSPNQGGSAGSRTLYQPGGNPAVVNGVLYLPDTQNHRVLGFNSVPVVNNAAADFVLGQPNLTSGTRGVSATSMDVPLGLMSSNGKFFAADANNNRVLIWNSVPTTVQASPDLVLGQSGFLTAIAACTQSGMSFPTAVAAVGGKLVVADGSNNRVLIWNSIPTANGSPADVVLGQGDFTHCQYNDDNKDGVVDPAPTGRTLNYPSGIWSDGTRLVVVDNGNSRVLIWNSIPSTSFTEADLVLGQGDLTHGAANDDNQTGIDGSLATARTLCWPVSVDSDGTRLVLSDSGNNRVLIWNTLPSANFSPANTVLGQGDFTHRASNDDIQNGTDKSFPTARTVSSPQGVYLLGSKLFVGDTNNSRYLIFEEQ